MKTDNAAEDTTTAETTETVDLLPASLSELDGLKTTFDALVVEEKYEEAEEMGNAIKQRIAQSVAEWKTKLEDVERVTKKIQRARDNEESWKRVDRTVANLEEHHPQLLKRLQDVHGRGLECHLRSTPVKSEGKGKLLCNVEIKQWAGDMEICTFNIDDEKKMLIHQLRSYRHPGVERELVEEVYPSLDVGMSSRNKIHRPGKHTGKKMRTLYRIDDRVLTINETSSGTVRSSYDFDYMNVDWCRTCFKLVNEHCGNCGCVMTKEGCLFGCVAE